MKKLINKARIVFPFLLNIIISDVYKVLSFELRITFLIYPIKHIKRQDIHISVKSATLRKLNINLPLFFKKKI